MLSLSKLLPQYETIFRRMETRSTRMGDTIQTTENKNTMKTLPEELRKKIADEVAEEINSSYNILRNLMLGLSNELRIEIRPGFESGNKCDPENLRLNLYYESTLIKTFNYSQLLIEWQKEIRELKKEGLM